MMSAEAAAVAGAASMGEGTPATQGEEALRGNVYSLLAGLLVAPPQQSLIDLLRGIAPLEGESDQQLAPAWETVRLAAERTSPEALDDEYHALFIGIGRGELVPYGSWYMTGFLMDRPLAILRRDLAELGFERQEEVSEPEDHAAALLETMSLLIADDGVDIDVQRRFFQSHMEPWMKVFFADLQKAPSARFYRAVGQLGEKFIEFETKYLTMLV